MVATQSHIRSALNDLIETCKDGQEGFRIAAENVEAPDLKEKLNGFSLQRAKLAGALQQAVIQLGDPDPEDSGSAAGTIHQGWINLKGAVMGRDNYQILAECEAGEDSAVKAYKKALDLELPNDVRATVQEQYTQVKAAHDEVKRLRDAAKK